ncbi:OmpA family protein [Algibacter miyuki]|nr:OmpA family protein [Algibacter miyuki]MDN3664536.1 OmpA family protein [Algibacter miyuki]
MKKITQLQPLVLLLLLIFLSGFSTLYGQERQLEKASKEFEGLDYINAQKIYLSVADKGFESEELFTKLAESYYFNAQYDEASKWYARLFDLVPSPVQNVSKLRYSQALKAIGKSRKAKDYYDAYRTKVGDTVELRSAIDYASIIEANSGRYSLDTVHGLYNLDKISFGHTKIEDQLIFASTAIESDNFINRKSGWDGLSYLSLYAVDLDSTNQITGKERKLKGKLNSTYHESSAVYTKDLNTMYFTRSNNTSKKRKDDKNLKIYRTQKEDGKWSTPEELDFNSDHYSSAHPALSPDEKTLYFASDRPGGYGESDLYRVKINEDLTLEAPENLGSKINTPGKETFPFVDQDNSFYFSSDGHFGLGGLDVFYIKIKADDTFDNLLNVGTPINSYADDFAFGINEKYGFISSNRAEVPGTFVYDNIYTFIENAPIKDLFKAEIEGVVTDKHTGEPIAGAHVKLTNEAGEVYAELETDQDGYYHVETARYDVYTILVSKTGYDSDDKRSESGLEKQKIDFQLVPKMRLTPGTDLSDALNIPIIYFDLDKYNIRPDAGVELQKVVEAMKLYPQLKIDIRSHTDSRASDQYNMVLSNNRAKSTMDYIIASGIDRNRLSSRGYGETQLVNKCSNGVPCTKAEHQANRRSEFIIVK